MPNYDAAHQLEGFSSRELFDELTRRGAIDMLEVNQILEGRIFLGADPEKKAAIIQRQTAYTIHELSGWLAQNGVISTSVHERVMGEDPSALPSALRGLEPGTVMLVTGMFARVPGYNLDDRLSEEEG